MKYTMSKLTRISQIFITFLFIFVLCYVFIPSPSSTRPSEPKKKSKNSTEPPIPVDNFKYVDGIYQHESDKKCENEDWNMISTSSIPRVKLLRELVKQNVTASEGLSDGELRLLSAYLYPDEIVVTTTRQRPRELGRSVYCRYYDCNRVEIPDSMFKSFFFPLTAVYCARRAGAHYISLSFGLYDGAPPPIPFVKRLDEKHSHELGICVGQIYGFERKWMELVEFVEHHKIIGASMFYFTVFSMDEYSRRVLDEYVRTGYAEVTNVDTEYTNGLVYIHMIQVHDCFFRARHHSKWMLNIDHDEYLVPTRTRFLNYIDSLSSQFSELIFSIRRVRKTDNRILKEYTTPDDIKKNVQMAKFNKTADILFSTSKVMVQPTKVEAVLLHWAYGHSPGFRALTVPKSKVIVNHYRSDTKSSFATIWSNTSMIEVFDKSHVNLLSTKMVQTIEYVFKKHDINCDTIPYDWKIITEQLLKKMNIC